MKKSLFILPLSILAILFGSSIQSIAAPISPTITHSINGLAVTVSWTNVPGATQYKLLYAPIPYTGPASIASLDVGAVTSFTASLWEGAAFYVAVQAGDGQSFSEYSNIGEISIASASANLNGNWRMTETWGPNNCGYPVGMQINEDIFITQSNSTVTGLDDTLREYNGTIAGNTGSLTYLRDDEDFSETRTINFNLLPDNTLSGSISWRARDKHATGTLQECLMNFSFTAISAPANDDSD